VALSFDCSDSSLDALSRSGYRRIRRFVALPSLGNPRWLVPDDNSRQARRGLDLYTPFSAKTRLLKAVGTGVAAAGFRGVNHARLLVASKENLPIENLVKALTGESRPGFAVSIGTSGTCQKLTVQAMSPGGEILAYIKLPIGPGAQERIKAEAAMLEKLSHFPKMRLRVPRLLHASAWGESTILVQSRLVGRAGPAELTSQHDEFLRDLHGCAPVECPGEVIVARTELAWKRFGKSLSPEWHRLADDAIRIAAKELSSSTIRCAPMHGDFAPWNTRNQRERLTCFDWESSIWQAPVEWDRFHFLSQTESLIGKGSGPEMLPETMNGGRTSFLLYLLHSAAQLAAEHAVPEAIAYRESMLRRQLSVNCAGKPGNFNDGIFRNNR
jgi:hypothetical protein